MLEIEIDFKYLAVDLISQNDTKQLNAVENKFPIVMVEDKIDKSPTSDIIKL